MPSEGTMRAAAELFCEFQAFRKRKAPRIQKDARGNQFRQSITKRGQETGY
jgi:hypothetical protein